MQTIEQLEYAMVNKVFAMRGIKASLLRATLAVEFIAYDKNYIKGTLIRLIGAGMIKELEYVLPDGTNEGLLVPRGTRFPEFE